MQGGALFDASLVWGGGVAALVLFVYYLSVQDLAAMFQAVEARGAFSREARFFVGTVLWWSLIDLVLFSVKGEGYYLCSALVSLLWMIVALVAFSPRLGCIARRGAGNVVYVHTRRARRFAVAWGASLVLVKLAMMRVPYLACAWLDPMGA